MKYSKGVSGSLIAFTLLLGGCATFDGIVTGSNTTPPKVEQPIAPKGLLPSDPWQREALVLQAKPNRYQEESALVNVPDSAKSRFAAGAQLLKQGKLDEAKSLYETMSQHYPALSGVWVQLGSIAEKQAHVEQAIAYLRQAINLQTSNYLAHNHLGLLYRQQGKFSVALNHYNQALDSWPAFTQARLNRGILYDLYLGEKEQALADYQVYQALLTQPDRKVKSWIADLERQLQASNASSGSIKEDAL